MSDTPQESATQESATAPTARDRIDDIHLPMLTTTLARVQEQIKFADAKGGLLATLNVFLAGFVIQSTDRLGSAQAGARHAAFWIAIALLAAYILVTFVSVAYVLLAVMPRLVDSTPNTRTFFSHIKKQYGSDHRRYYQDITAMTPHEWAVELSAQIVAVSHIADRKHRLIHRAALWMIASLALWIAVLTAMQFSH